MFFDFSKLRDWQYLSNPYPPSDFPLKNDLFIIAGVLVIIGILWWIILGRFQKKYKILEGPRYRIFYFSLFFGIIISILVFFRIEGIPYFSSRFVFLLFLFAMFVWFLSILYFLIRKYPREKAEYNDKLRKDKYLPKKRKKR
jgi:hypothetical protein